MDDNPLQRLRAAGQSIWLVGLRREFVTSGELARLVESCGINGAIADLRLLAGAIEGAPYLPLIETLSATDPQRRLEALLLDEARVFAKPLLRCHEESAGSDGYVAVPVDVSSHDDADAMTRSAHRILGAGEPNIMPCLPPTESGLAVFEALTAEGRAVQMGPIYSLDGVDRAAAAFVRAAHRFVEGERQVGQLNAVISFGLGSLDAEIDAALRLQIGGREGDTSSSEALLGSTAVAVAKVACRRLREKLARELPESLRGVAANLVRLMWIDLGSADPRLPKLHYVESLAGPDAIVGMPRSFVRDFARAGAVSATLGQRVDEAERIVAEVEALGIDLDGVGRRLEDAAAKQLETDAHALSEAVHAACEALEADAEGAIARVAAGSCWSAGAVEIPQALFDAGASQVAGVNELLWRKDTAAWPGDDDAHESMRSRLGWLDLHEAMPRFDADMTPFADKVAGDNFEHVLLTGMGGSSLCADVLRTVFGVETFAVLDSTIPSQVRTISEAADPARTMHVIASKSGGTIEVRALLDYLYGRLAPIVERPGARFVAITDPGTPLEHVAHEKGFRRSWLAPADIGGRFSALTVFGTVPMALMGIDTKPIIDSAVRMAARCAPEVEDRRNPAARLAAALAGAHAEGRDKLTLVCSPSLASFAPWVEQLVAESTGKDGRGLIPIVDEPWMSADRYANDRLFVALRLHGDDDQDLEDWLTALEACGQPVIRIELQEPSELGGEFLRWECAVAIAGAALDINPFDQPDVQASKDRTVRILAAGMGEDSDQPAGAGPGWWVFADLERDTELAERRLGEGLDAWMRAHLGRAAVPDYVALQAFLPAADRRLARVLDEIRRLVLERLGVASTRGWGPSFLHSTGQLHKGGPASGIFVQITADDVSDIELPGADYTLGGLARAQSRGDFGALQEIGRRVIRVHAVDASTAVDVLLDAVDRGLS